MGSLSSASPAPLVRPPVLPPASPLLVALRGRGLARVLAVVAAAVCLFLPASARADWIGDLMKERDMPFCPIIYGPACRISLSVDFMAEYQVTRRGGVEVETGVRAGGELALLVRLGGSDVHLGGGVEVAGRGGDLTTGFHVAPRLRARFFPWHGPVALELGAGPLVQRTWLADGSGAGTNRFGLSSEASIGVLGFASFVMGADVAGNAQVVPGDEVNLFLGARLSILSLAAILFVR